jgi:hypothetical protein
MAIRVRLGQDEVQVEPGGSAQLLAVVRNEGDAPDQVALEVEGVDAEWCAIPIPSFSLAPGEEVQERILIRPPRSTESRAGTYPILVRARSLENGGSGVAQASITIRPYSMLTLEIAPKRGIVSPLAQARALRTHPRQLRQHGADRAAPCVGSLKTRWCSSWSASVCRC